MVMYSTEITVGAALLIGFALGAWIAYEYGKDKGFVRGYELGRGIGFELGLARKPKRDKRGRFLKCS